MQEQVRIHVVIECYNFSFKLCGGQINTPPLSCQGLAYDKIHVFLKNASFAYFFF